MAVEKNSPALPVISVIIVTWNCADLLVDCLRSLALFSGDLIFEIIVVDNASTDHTIELLRREFPDVVIVANKENKGFAKANNQGMSIASAPLFCLLNPDTILFEADTLVRIVKYMGAYTEIGAAGCKLVYPDGRYQVGDAGGMPTMRAVIAHALFLTKLFPRFVQGLFLQENSVAPPYGRVGWVCGACTIVRREIFLETMGFDESYFLYGEDVEWGSRMSKAGIFVAYFPNIHIIHIQGGTQRGKGLPSTKWLDGIARLFFDYNAGRNWRLFRFIMMSGFVSRGLIYTVFSGSGSGKAQEMLVYAKYIWHMPVPKKTTNGE